MRIFCLKKILIGCLYLSISQLSFAVDFPQELVGTWGPEQSTWGKGADGKPSRCDVNYSTGNNPEIFKSIFPNGKLVSGMFSAEQCRLKRIDKLTAGLGGMTTGYSAILNCVIEGSIKETLPLIYWKNDRPSIEFSGQKLYKCKSTP
jgi:hypothetical protein